METVVFEPGSRLERIGDHAFAGTALKEFVAPGSLKTIGAGAFANCKSLKQVRLNEGLEIIGGGEDKIFRGSELEEIYLPSTLQEMRSNIFTGCESLKKVRVADGCKVDVKNYVPPTVAVETVALRAQEA